MKCDFFKRFTNRTATKNLTDKTTQNDSRLGSLIILSDVVYTRKWKPVGLAWKCIEYGKLCARSSIM